MKIDLEFHKLDDLAAMIVGYKDGAPVRLRDIAEIEDGLTDNRQLARLNGKPAVGIGIVKVPNTNTVEIIDRVLERIERDVRPQLPPGLELHVVQSDKIFIGAMVGALKNHLVEGTLLAALIVWLFLKSFRSTVIIACSIPVSLMGAIAVMYFFGYTFNSVTLLALLLLVGVVVDDSIVVLENIYRHREEDRGTSAMSAAITGSREVTFAVIAASFSLVAIFAPVVFVSGILGQFLRSFAVVVTFGVLVSLFVSLTLTPMLCSRYLDVQEKHGRVYWALERFFDGVDRLYRRLLGWSLRNRGLVLGAGLLAFAIAIPIFQRLPRELAPQADEGRFLVGIRTPLGSSIAYTESKLREVEEIAFRYPEIVTEFGVIGLGSTSQVNQATLVARMKPRDERERSQAEVINALRRELAQVAGARAFPRAFGLVQGQRSEPLQFVVKGPNLQEMGRLAVRAAAHAAGRPRDRPHGHRPAARPAAADPRARPGARRRPQPHLGRRRARGEHAHRRHRHREVQRLSWRRRALRHPRQGERGRVPAAGGPVEDLPAQPPGPARAPRPGGALPRGARAGGDLALRPAVLGDLLRHADHLARRGDRKGARRRREPADRLPRGVRRRGRAAREDRRGDAVHLHARARAALHGARQPVQQLPAAVLHHARGAARHRRRHRCALAFRQHAQHLFGHRPRAC